MKNATSSSDDPADPLSVANAVIKGHGASAAAFAARLRAANANLHSHELADFIARHHVKQAARFGVAAARPSESDQSNADPVGAGDAVLLLRLQFRMLLEIAAVYGLDPADPERATELTRFCGPEREADSARIVVARIGDRLLTWLVHPRGPLAALGLLQRHRQIVHGLTPYVGAGAGALAYSATTMALARQAVNFYDPSPVAGDPTSATRAQGSMFASDASRLLGQ